MATAGLASRRAVADVCPLHDDHQLQWPPSAADLDSVVAVSLDDDGVRRLASVLVGRTEDKRLGRRRGLAPAALAAACLIAGGSVVWWVLDEPGADTRQRRAVAAVMKTETDAPRRDAGIRADRVAPAGLRVDKGDRLAAFAGTRRAEGHTRAVAPSSANVPALAVPTDVPGVLEAAPAPGAAPRDRVEIAVSVPSGALSGAVPVELAAMPARRASSPEGIEARPATSDVARAQDEPAIRALLEQYGAAYSRLDARAAGAVWPGVNVQALARAFDALESQAIDFERCDVQVEGTAARAACRGTSTWVPRIGERRARRDAREWTFRLARDPDAQWRIQSASMR